MEGTGPQRRRRAAALLTLVLMLAPVACGDSDEASLCEDYEHFLTAGAAVQAIDPLDSSAADATELLENYYASVRQMQHSADGRYGAELETLAQSILDVQRTLDSVEDDADYATWAPLVEDSVEAMADASVTVVNRIGPTCAQDSDA